MASRPDRRCVAARALVTGAARALTAELASREDVARFVEEMLLEANAVKRMIQPEEVADAVVYLCRPGAWTQTGSVLTLDAGWLAH